MSEYITICEQAARAGGAVLLDWFGRVSVREKGPADLVTEADLASQAEISRVLRKAFPDHALLGEEDGGRVGPCRPDEYRWIVDPLDGTTNYAHGVPHYSVSVALERGDALLAGTVYNPASGECYVAGRGAGARLNGRPIHTSSVTALRGALAAIGLPPGVRRDAPDLRAFIEMVSRCQGIRRTGSAALNLCCLAAGRFDAAWSFSTHIWDVAAGVLLIREAGGQVSSAAGGPFSPEQGHFVAAATPPLHAEICQVLKGILTIA